MKKIIALLLTSLMLLAALPALPVLAEEEAVLNIFTWETYIDYETIIKPFTEATGIKVNYANFDSNEAMLSKLQAVGGGEYDIVLASDYILDIARGENLLMKLDKEKIPNFANINPKFQSKFYDPDNEYTVPYAAGTPLIVYDPALVDFEITGYEDLWNPALKDSIVAMDDARNLIGITLKTMGESFNTTDPAILAKAREKLLELKPNIRALDYNTPHQLLISGEATVGYMFTPQVAWALTDRPDLKVVYPKEGLGFGIDSIVVPVKAPHPDNAQAFINFLLTPEIGAKIAQVQFYMNCNLAAEPLLAKELLDNNVIYISGDIQGEGEFIMDVGEALPIYDEMWTAFKQQ